MPPTADVPEFAAPATVVGKRYRIVRPLRHGGMGAVLEAEDLHTGRRVALKVTRPELSLAAEARRSFEVEARTTSRLAHPHVVATLDSGEDTALGLLYIAMELLDGRDLRAHLADVGRMPARVALTVMTPVMEALAAAHDKGVVHCDVKPENIVLVETPRGVSPRLIDFGIARVLGAPRSPCAPAETPHGLVGTPGYMAPEQVLENHSLDARVDVWAAGVVLYELLSGVRPYTGETPHAVLAKVLFEDPTPLAEVAPQVPADVLRAVMTALERDPAARHPTMRAFLDALRGCAVMRPAEDDPPRPRGRPHGTLSLGIAALTALSTLVSDAVTRGADARLPPAGIPRLAPDHSRAGAIVPGLAPDLPSRLVR